MPFVQVCIHFVWTTKYRFPYLNTPELRKIVWEHIRENALEKGIQIDFVNGYEDHCHCLVFLSSDQTISKVMHLIKGESAHWINKNQLVDGIFEWQDEYFAISVSQSVLKRTRSYIANQEIHHSKASFDKEYDTLVKNHSFIKDKKED